MPKFRLIKAHRNEYNSIILWGRDEHGMKFLFTVETFKPYFFVKESDTYDCPEITSTEFGYTSLHGEKLRKVFVSNPSLVPVLRDKFVKHWEADIPFSRRFLISSKITNGFDENLLPAEPPDVEIDIGYTDIEVYATNSMPNPDRDQITCIGFSDGKQYTTIILDDADFQSKDNGWAIIHLNSEEKCLECFCNLLEERNVDCLLGWNISWDLDYLEKRCNKYQLQLPMSGTCPFDLLWGYKRLYRRKSYRLKDIALDEGLTDTLEEKVNYAQLWEKDKSKLMTRNRRHVEWCVDLDKKLSIVPYYWELKELVGMENMDSFYPTVLFDTMLLRRATCVLPSKSSSKERHEYEGAFVMEPETGILESVAVFDLSKFYPTLIIQEKLDTVIVNEYRKHFGDTKIDWEQYRDFANVYEGPTLLLGLVENMIEQRKRLEKMPEHKGKLVAIKSLLNSAYGISAAPHFRLYEPCVPERVTELAREIIKFLIAEAQSSGYQVIYSDTDSIFCRVPKSEVPALEDALNQSLLKYGDYNIKFEHYFSKLLMAGKKRYVGIMENGDLYIIGFEQRRSDSSEITKDLQEEVMRMMLADRVSEIVPYLKDRIESIKQCPLSKIAITKTLSRELSEYTKQEQSYILAIKQATWMKPGAGESVNLVPALNYPYGVLVYQDIEDLPYPVEIDWKTVIEKQVENKVRDLLPLVSLSWSEVEGQQRLL